MHRGTGKGRNVRIPKQLRPLSNGSLGRHGQMVAKISRRGHGTFYNVHDAQVASPPTGVTCALSSNCAHFQFPHFSASYKFDCPALCPLSETARPLGILCTHLYSRMPTSLYSNAAMPTFGHTPKARPISPRTWAHHFRNL
jgi:hypothetical protein